MTPQQIHAMKQALEALKEAQTNDDGMEKWDRNKKAIAAIKEVLAEHAMSEVQRLGQEIEQEPVMILPDGSAFGVMSFPLPDDHWLYAPNEYKDGEYEPIDLPKPILTHELRDAVVAAVRYAVRGATMRGQETDFDPDALVQNAVYALCGPYATPPKPKPEQEPVALQMDVIVVNLVREGINKHRARELAEHFIKHTTPPQRTWVGLTDEEIKALASWWPSYDQMPALMVLAKDIQNSLKEKNT